jgi:putative cardiolipin synthase
VAASRAGATIADEKLTNVKSDFQWIRTPPLGTASGRASRRPPAAADRRGSVVRARVAEWIALLTLVAILPACASLPKNAGRVPSSAILDTGGTRIGRSVEAAAASHPGESGIYPLAVPQDAFAARVALARRAERSLDVQYYIWHADTTGIFLLGEIWDAAERGVRVRMLLDDNGIAGLDPTLAALDSHPRIEVRLFNPYPNRKAKVLGYLTEFGRLNRRMHNKSFTADARATVVGGRNIGDEYFGAGDGMVFTDLDVLAAGPIALDVEAAFDLYWNSESAYPLASIVPEAGSGAVPAMQARFEEVRASPDAARYVEAVKATKLVEELATNDLRLEWSRVQLICDPPAKTLGKAETADLVLAHLKQAIGDAKRELDIISPYFVPRGAGTNTLCRYPEEGARLRILTNSLSATDTGLVHAGYSKSRKPLLRCGAELWELKRTAEAARGARKATKQKAGSGGSSSASLHAKTFSADRRRAFVGSFNLDPRSASLNTEMGLVIDDPTLAAAISDWLDQSLRRLAYRVVLGQGGGLEWIEQTEQGEVRLHTEPETTFFGRLTVSILRILPIDWML